MIDDLARTILDLHFISALLVHAILHLSKRTIVAGNLEVIVRLALHGLNILDSNVQVLLYVHHLLHGVSPDLSMATRSKGCSKHLCILPPDEHPGVIISEVKQVTLLDCARKLLILLHHLFVLLDLHCQLLLLQARYFPAPRILLVNIESAVIDGLSPEGHGEVGRPGFRRERLHGSLV